ncbi:uncharacterized protein Bfra_002042 [Botrytis fragariae]|uniref:Uncharacterized protein n=1 Tax=Botrytis fragariae TaxID=1964551 RepID=A0A8H6B1Y8_9HELO|nr:uncharacterized protein Bfra_002042 [Botrytis fragariae]KAF5877675.1 hypothetical protein Bfra_002042 [Botrytis fragariae]
MNIALKNSSSKAAPLVMSLALIQVRRGLLWYLLFRHGNLEILLPALEKLRIEMNYEYDWLKFFSFIPVYERNFGTFNDDTDLELEELSDFICEIVKNKDTQCIGLREERCAEVFEACKAANVHISYNGHGTAP